MQKELFEHSPLLVLPLVAMFLFLLVWVAAAVRVLTQSREEMAAAARGFDLAKVSLSDLAFVAAGRAPGPERDRRQKRASRRIRHSSAD